MARVQGFYNTTTWQNCRNAYVKSVGGICERCYEKGLIRHGEHVHHIIHLTPDNVSDPNISTSFDNLILLCRECHEAEHLEEKSHAMREAMKHKSRKRFTVNAAGKVEAIKE